MQTFHTALLLDQLSRLDDGITSHITSTFDVSALKQIAIAINDFA